MNFLLEKDGELNVSVAALKEQLKNSGHNHSFMEMSLKELDNACTFPIDWKQIIPVGSIKFVKCILIKQGIISYNGNMNQIDIPKELRQPDFLLRNYATCRREHLMNVPNIHPDQKVFIRFGNGLADNCNDIISSVWASITLWDVYYDDEKLFTIDENDIYIVSDLMQFLSEHRVFVYHDEIKGIHYRKGAPLLLPSSTDIEKIKEMVQAYSQNENRPDAYVLDVGITEKGLAIIKVQPWCAIDLCGCQGKFLPDAYIEGFKWYVEKNYPLEPTV